MVKRLLLLVVLGSAGIAYGATPCGAYSDFSTVTAASNLYAAMNGKFNIQCGAGSPMALAGTAGVDGYINTSTGNFYICLVTGTPCGTWFQVNPSPNTPLTVSFNSSTSTCTVLQGTGSCTASPTAGYNGGPLVTITDNYGTTNARVILGIDSSGGSAPYPSWGDPAAASSITSVKFNSNSVLVSFVAGTTAIGTISDRQ